MTPFKVTIGGSVPSGPIGKPTISGGGSSKRSTFRTPASKKGYTGSIAGIGRTSRISSHPHGPGFARRAHATLGSRLPVQGRVSLTPKAPKQASVFSRVAKRARAAVFGF